jgi:hypothetical protein
MIVCLSLASVSVLDYASGMKRCSPMVVGLPTCSQR